MAVTACHETIKAWAYKKVEHLFNVGEQSTVAQTLGDQATVGGLGGHGMALRLRWSTHGIIYIKQGATTATFC